jgi:hypothetical protein
MAMPRPFFIVLVAGLAFSAADHDALAQASRLNRGAQALATQLAPTPVAKAYNKEALGTLQQRMITVLETVEASAASNGPPAASLVRKALEFRHDLGDWERQMLTNAVVAAWGDARSMGLFDEHGKFRETITQGRDVGDDCAFELIVPGDLYPPASNQLSNVRIVREKEKRAENAEVTPRDEAFRDQFARLTAEKASRAKQASVEKKGSAQIAKIENGPKTNAVGQTDAQHLALWEKEMSIAGKIAAELPSIRVSADSRATPSQMNGQRWRVECEVTNLSKYPTEVTAEVWVLGVTEAKRAHYVMTRVSKNMKLRVNETRTFDVFTAAEGSYQKQAAQLDGADGGKKGGGRVRYRGCVIRAVHAKGVAGFAGSDTVLAGYADAKSKDSPLLSLPKF